MQAPTTTTTSTNVTKTFKLFFATQDIRRITLDNVATWEAFHQQLIELYPDTYHPELAIRYKDDEDDLISITCQREWEAMLDATKDQSTVRLLLSEGHNQGKYFKDGPPPVTQQAYVQTDDTQTPVDESKMRTLQVQLPRCLARFFPGGQILPTSVPSWLEGCIEIKRVEAQDPTIDLDVDVTKLFDRLHEEAMQRIGADKDRSVIENAKQYLQSMIDMVPTHPIANYNMACVNSLLGDVKEAAESLRTAICGGYNNLSHMLQDVDLENLRATSYFQDLVNLLQRQQKDDTSSATTQEPAVLDASTNEFEMIELPVVPVVAEPEPIQPQAEVVIPQTTPAPVAEVPATKYPAEQATLQSMGFNDVTRNERLLARHRGDVAKCINDLL